MTEVHVANYCIAVHVGAGYHSERHASEYRRLIAAACHAAVDVLKEGNATALEAVVAAVRVLELHPLTNAARGSNLNLRGRVECDASVMRGPPHPTFGAVGALPGVLHPVEVACQLAQERCLGPLPLGRIRPIFLAGPAAREWAEIHTPYAILPANDTEGLVTTRTLRQWQSYTCMMDAVNEAEEPCTLPPVRRIRREREAEAEESRFKDTVGAVCVDGSGQVAAAVSSGGIAMKFPGRVGEAAVYSAGCWAEEGCGASCSGAGEEIMLALLARSACQLAHTCEGGPAEACQECLEGIITNSEQLSNSTDAAILLLQKRDMKRTSAGTCESVGVELVASFTTQSFAIGYQTSRMSACKALILRRAEDGREVITNFSTFTPL